MRSDSSFGLSPGQAGVAEEGLRSGDRSPGGRLTVVGLGPGDREQMTLRALRALEEAETIVGYKTYLALIEDLLEGKEVLSSGMTKEVDRSRAAVAEALKGKNVAVVSSGDSGVFGMAGIILEVLYEMEAQDRVEVEVVPGVPSANAAAATLGAPLMHDYVTLSLSDLLTPWELILKRVEYAAQGDFVIALYNPKSKSRVEQIEIVRELLLRHKDPKTPVGIVRNAKRGAEEMVISDLEHFTQEEINMFTMVIIGNSQTFVQGNHMITPRGYRL